MCREALGQGRRKALLLFTRSCCVVRAFCFLASFSLAASRKKERVGNKWARDDDAPLHYHLHLFSSAVFYFIFSGRAPISRLHGVHVLTRGPRWERFPHQPAGRPTDRLPGGLYPNSHSIFTFLSVCCKTSRKHAPKKEERDLSCCPRGGLTPRTSHDGGPLIVCL